MKQRARTPSRSSQRSRTERQTHFQGPNVRYIASAHKAFSLLVLDANEIPPELLQQVKTWATVMLESTFAEVVADFPHHLDGGWPDVDPMDNFILYGTIQTGQLAGVSAAAIGTNKMMRERGVCLALVLAAAVEIPNILTDQILQQYDPGLPGWVAEARRLHTRLLKDQDRDAKPCSKPRSRPRSRSRGRASGSARRSRSRGRASGSALKVQELVDENMNLRQKVIKLREKLNRVAEIAKC